MDAFEKSIAPVRRYQDGFVLVFVMALVLVGLLLGVGRLAREQHVRQQAVEYEKYFARESDLYRAAYLASSNPSNSLIVIITNATSMPESIPSWLSEPFGIRFVFSPALDTNYWLNMVISGNTQTIFMLSMANRETNLAVRTMLFPQTNSHEILLDTNFAWGVSLDNLRVTITNGITQTNIPLGLQPVTSAGFNVSGIFTSMTISSSMNITTEVYHGYDQIASIQTSNRLAGSTNWLIKTNRLYIKNIPGGFLTSE